MKVGSSAAKGTPEPCGGGGPLGAGNPPAAGPGTLPSAGKFTGVGGGGPLSRAGSPPAGGPGTLPSSLALAAADPWGLAIHLPVTLALCLPGHPQHDA